MVILVLAVSTFALQKVRQSSLLSRAIILGDPDKIIVINAESSQDVIIVGDPDKVQVKPKKR